MTSVVAVPRIDGDMDALQAHARSVRAAGVGIAATGEQVVAVWQQLGAVYRAPETGELLAAMGPVQQATASIGEDVQTVSRALVAYAVEVRSIQARLDALRARAAAVAPDPQLAGSVTAAMADFEAAQRRCAAAITALHAPPVSRLAAAVHLPLIEDVAKGGLNAYKLYNKVYKLPGNIEAAGIAARAFAELDAARSMIPFARTFDDVVDVFGQLGGGSDYTALYMQLRNAEWVGSAKAVGLPLSNLSKGLAGLGIITSGYDLLANPAGHGGARRGVDIAADVAGIASSGAALGIALGVLSVTPVGLAVIAGAGAATALWAGGNYVYDHWDGISHGAEAAAGFVADGAVSLAKDAGHAVDDVAGAIGKGVGGAFHSVFG